MRAILKDFGVVLLQVLLAFAAFALILEPAVRILRPQSLLMKGKETFFPGDPDLQFAIRPNAETVLARRDFKIKIASNALGFRDVNRGPKDGALRVLVLGDSFTFGWGAERDATFEVQMERLQAAARAERHEPPLEVVNAGVPGYNLYQSLLALGKKGWKVDPDVVVLAAFIQNDFSENSETEAWLERKKTRPRQEKERGGVVGWLEEHSQAYVWLRVKYKSSYRLQRMWYKLTRPFNKKEERYKYRNLLVFQKPVPAEMETEWRLSEQLLVRLRDAVRARGRRLLVALVPSELQVVRGVWERDGRKEGLDPGSFDLEAPNLRVAAFCHAAGIPVVDLLPAFRAASRGGEVLYLPSDHHWNAEGHRLAAEILLAELRKRGWLAPSPGA
jgi:lysophospholipase L1-like esterase